MIRISILVLLLSLHACSLGPKYSEAQIAQWSGHYQGQVRNDSTYLNFELLIDQNLKYQLAIDDLRERSKEKLSGRSLLKGDSLLIKWQNKQQFVLSSDSTGSLPGFPKLSFERLKPDSNNLFQNWICVQVRDQYLGTSPQTPLNLSIMKDSIFGGFSGCNSYGGTYVKDSMDGLQFPEITTTLLLCDKQMDLEALFSQSLRLVRYYHFRDPKHLRLLDSNRQEILYLRRSSLLEDF
jgi:heat shock protein HslJ